MPYEVRLLLLFRLYGNLLPETLDRHEDNAMLTRLLEELLRLVLVANHQLGLVCLNFLKFLLLFSNQVGELEGPSARFLVESVQVIVDHVDS